MSFEVCQIKEGFLYFRVLRGVEEISIQFDEECPIPPQSLCVFPSDYGLQFDLSHSPLILRGWA